MTDVSSSSSSVVQSCQEVSHTLRVTSPNGQQHVQGDYELMSARASDGVRLWKLVGGELWLYRSPANMFFIGGTDEKELGFQCEAGFLRAVVPAEPAMPDEVTSPWSRMFAGDFVEDDDITVTKAPQPSMVSEIETGVTEVVESVEAAGKEVVEGIAAAEVEVKDEVHHIVDEVKQLFHHKPAECIPEVVPENTPEVPAPEAPPTPERVAPEVSAPAPAKMAEEVEVALKALDEALAAAPPACAEAVTATLKKEMAAGGYFTIEVQSSTGTRTVDRRFTEFADLKREVPEVATVQFPPKTLGRPGQWRPHQLQARREGLEAWLGAALTSAGEDLNPSLRRFLEVPDPASVH